MKKILKWFSLLFAVSVTVFVIFFLYNINSDITVSKPQPLEYKSIAKKQEAQALWLNHLSDTKKKGYFFPVDEVYIETKLEVPKKSSTNYELVVNELDPYQIFCLEQELKRFTKEYFLKKEDKKLQVYVYAKQLDDLKALTKVLQRYNIEAEIKQRVKR